MKKIIMLFVLLLAVFSVVSCTKKPTGKPSPDDPVDPQPQESVLDKVVDAKYAIKEGSPLYLTTVGQADLDIVRNIISRVEGSECVELGGEKTTGKVSIEFKNLLRAEDVKPGSVVFLVTGTSNKGLGSAGVDVASEKARAQAFGEAAERGDITLILLHVGGPARRGTSTDPVLEIACPKANLMLVLNTGNADNFFTNNAKANNVDLYLYSKLTEMVASFKVILGL